MSILGTHPYQCTSWWCCERLGLASANFFWRLNAFAHFMVGDLQAHLPTLCWVNFWPKIAWPPLSHLPYSSDLALSNFFLLFVCSPRCKKSSKGNILPTEEVKQKKAEALKVIKINEFENFWAVAKNVSIGILHQMESTLKVTEVQTCKTKYTILYK